MLKTRLTIISLIGAIACFLFADCVFGQELIAPLPTLNADNVPIFEGVSYCSTGIGTQTFLIKIADEHVYSQRLISPFIPTTDITHSPFLRVGCQLNRYVFDYGLYENSFKFNKSIIYKGHSYNLIEFKSNQIAVGYSFTLIPHRFHLDLGLGYSQTQYRLDYVNNGNVRGDDSLSLNSSGSFYQINLKVFASPHLYFHWLNQQALDDNNVISYSNQLGVNYLVRL